MTNRAEHLEWCKKRALEYLDMGDIEQAWASFSSDMTKHDETAKHPGIPIGIAKLMTGCTIPEMRTFINGFN